MKTGFTTALTLLAIGCAGVVSFPHETTASSVFGAVDPTCTITGTKDRTCGSQGGGTCSKKRKSCYNNGTTRPSFICEATMGGDSDCDGTGFCAEEDHDKTNSVCVQPGT